jgi:hypothetical protein
MVPRLAGDGTDLRPHILGDIVRGAVRSIGHRPQDGQTLGRDLETVLAKKVGWIVGGHHRYGRILCPILDLVKIWAESVHLEREDDYGDRDLHAELFRSITRIYL